MSGTGLGNPDKQLLTNSGKLDRHFAEVATALFLSKFEHVDHDVTKLEVKIGHEPAYQYERLKIVSIHRNKKKSYLAEGLARGGYGSQICASKKTYAEYMYDCKFTRFVDHWHPILFPDGNRSRR